MYRQISFYLLVFIVCCACNNNVKKVADSPEKDTTTIEFKYAQNIKVEQQTDYLKVILSNPWKKGKTLHTYYIIKKGENPDVPDDGTLIHVPLERSVFFTTAHANLMEMLNKQKVIAGVTDPQYMLIPDVQKRLKTNEITNCGDGMKPDIEKIIDLKPDALLLSPFENSGGYGQLDELKIPIIECADYMETSALGRAEWMKFYGLLFGCEGVADSLFSEVEKGYLALKTKAKKAKQTLSVLPDRKTGSVWYVPGGASSVGLLYKDANGKYAFAKDTHSGSLALPFETILDKMGESDFWILTYMGTLNKKQLLSEYQGYAALKPFRTGHIYGCAVDKIPYFEEVSWRPDWLLNDLLQLFHPDLYEGKLRYYRTL
ncbi:ABC transporter substrate-binding protein [Prevotella brunnea]|uniref:ABC transporter substrate-binding protein n=1 Tax=Prevotella brunnea TaxID=2508867 RepID=A0A5C8GDV6_9BACT|nr:ABC transporter substrate-binding protein [Prevotella brunnea]MDR0185732.1 ABC transporter substrate-binding protein [Prevotella brunnea]TXJ60183.1 ABC transporter substrate-binding protein [Prevotella brunnea]